MLFRRYVLKDLRGSAYTSTFKRTIGRFALPSMRSDLPISDLDGITVWHEARLEEEHVENLPNMATADLVELLLNTRLSRERIIEWTDLAILYTQLGPRQKNRDDLRAALRGVGIRTATSFLCALERTPRGEVLPLPGLQQPLTTGMQETLRAALTTNSNLALLQRWRRMPAASRSSAG